MPITRRKRANPPDQPENNNHVADQVDNTLEMLAVEQPADSSAEGAGSQTLMPPARPESGSSQPLASIPPTPPPAANGDHVERPDYPPTVESGRRTMRGEVFRRPPQPPVQQPPLVPVTAAPLQPPSHEISLPLGNLLHLAYNPGYTGAEEARSTLLQNLAQESKAGGRARCWSCGSLAIVYDRWNTRSKTFGEVGVAICEICGVWSVM